MHNGGPGSPGCSSWHPGPARIPSESRAYPPARQDGESSRKAAASASQLISQGFPMPKIKTNRAAAKRFRKTASGKYKCGHANKSHILTKKATKRKRNLRQTNHVRAEDAGRLDRMLPYL